MWKTRTGSVRDSQEVGILECIECELVTHSEDLSSLVNYGTGSMHKWAAGYGDNLSSPKSDHLRRILIIEELKEAFNIETVLDFGCGNGELLQLLSLSHEVFGIEPDSGVRKLEQQGTLSGQIFDSLDTAIRARVSVDLVTLFHVVEHLYNPSEELAGIRKLLNPGGLLVVETPNSIDALLVTYESLDFQNFSYWSHHPMLYSRKSLEELVRRCGFGILKVEGVQRYGLENHLHWLSKGLPGGHEKWKGLLSPSTLQSYAEDLARLGQSDTLLLVAQKPHSSR